MSTGSAQRTSSQRHPLCPECGYDLFGIMTPMTRSIVCPECGEELDPRDLLRERRPGEWTIWIGLRAAALSLVIRCLIALPFVIGSLYLTHWAGQYVRRMDPTFLVPGVIGFFMAKRFSEKAGFESALLFASMAAACMFVTVLGEVIIQSVFTMPASARRAPEAETAIVAVVLGGGAMYRMWWDS